MKHFEEFIKTNEVRKTTRDVGLAKALQQDAQSRVNIILQLKLTSSSATLIFEQIYEAIRNYADALLACEGWKSYSHVASIAFLQKYAEITSEEVHKIDNAREKRNWSKYYAKKVIIEETKELIELYIALKPKFDKLIQRIIKV